MTTLLKTVRLEALTARLALRTGAIAVVIAIALSSGFGRPEAAAGFVLAFAPMLGMTIFSLHEANGGDRLYSVLPVRRAGVVAGRYALALIIGLVAAAVGLVIGLLVALIQRTTFSGPLLATLMAVMFAYYCLAVALTYPLYFRISVAKAQLLAMLPPFVIFFAAFFVLSNMGQADGIGAVLATVLSQPWYVYGLVVVVGLGALVASACGANALYGKRELS